MEEEKKKGIRYRREISIREVAPPPQHDIEKEIAWICECLGLAENENDLASEIFCSLIRASREREGMSSRELMEKKNVTQGAVVYHLNIFIQNGVVIKQGRKYFLRSSSLDETIEELEQDMLRRMKKLRELARHIDEEMKF